MLMFSGPARFCRRVAYCFGRESVYRSFGDRAKAVLLRIAAERGGVAKSRGGRPRVHSINLREMDQPIFVRKATSDFLVLRDIFEDEEYGQAALLGLPADANVMDLGGNIGMSVLYFASLCPESKLVAVEPDADNFEMLEMNCRGLVEAGRLTPVRAFVASSDGSAGIDRSDEAWGFKKVERSADAAADGAATATGGVATATEAAESIDCVSIPSLLARAGWDHIDVLKCDIEGTERELFADCDAWIGRVRHLIVETHLPYTPDDLFAALKRVGWEYRVVHQNLYTPAPRIFLSRV